MDVVIRRIKETPITLTEPVSTMITIITQLPNFKMHEKDQSDKATPTYEVCAIVSNFSEKYHESYTPPPLKVKTNKGRKKSVKVMRRTRAVSGSGKFFGSQASYYIRALNKIFKVKVFRNGMIQIPGCWVDGQRIIGPDTIMDILSKHLHADHQIPLSNLQHTQFTQRNSKMKNRIINPMLDEFHRRADQLNADAVFKKVNKVQVRVKARELMNVVNRLFTSNIHLVIPPFDYTKSYMPENEPKTKVSFKLWHSVEDQAYNVTIYNSGKIQVSDTKNRKDIVYMWIKKLLIDYDLISYNFTDLIEIPDSDSDSSSDSDADILSISTNVE